MLYLLPLLAGFLPLIFGANFLVDGASAIAKKLNIPNLVIGLTIVAFGTSAPELVVNVFGAVSGSTDISFGNVVGSNIFNILAILGLSAVIYPLAVKSSTTWIEIPLCVLSAVVMLVLAADIFIDKAAVSAITRIDGIILLLFFTIFLVYNFVMAKKGNADDTVAVKEFPLAVSILMVIGGLVLLVVGGRLIVWGATGAARAIGIPERIIALTIVSIGTSLPELATSAIAAKKKNVDIAIGNIVGSNIFNTFLILGISAVIAPIPVSGSAYIDLMVNIGASLLLFLFIFTGKGRRIVRWEGIVFLTGYISYTVFLILAR
jgi:cation:H+ antiporter